jgi:hypothetical protein
VKYWQSTSYSHCALVEKALGEIKSEKREILLTWKIFQRVLIYRVRLITYLPKYSALEQFSTHNSHKQWHSTFIFRDGTNYTAGCQKLLDNK